VKEGFIKDCVNWLKGKHWEDDIINVQPMRLESTLQTKSLTFAERDEQNRRKKWEEMTGLDWPDNNSTIDTTFTRIEQ